MNEERTEEEDSGRKLLGQLPEEGSCLAIGYSLCQGLTCSEFSVSLMPLEALKQRGSRQGSWRSLLPILHEEECFTPEDDASEHTHSFGPKALPSALISGADPRPVI